MHACVHIWLVLGKKLLDEKSDKNRIGMEDRLRLGEEM